MDFKMCILATLLLVGSAYAAPGPKADAAFVAPLVAAAPVVAAPPAVVTATSSQVIARNYNGIAAPLVAAPAAAAVAPVAPYTPFVATAPYAAYPAYASPYITYV